MKILVTGGTVFVSRYAAEYFVARGHDVYVLNRNTKPQPSGATPVIADRNDLRDVLKRMRFDAVLDVTAYNANDVNNLLDALGGFGKYVLISSSAVYPEWATQPFTENTATGLNRFWGDYGLGKIDAERALSSRVPDAYIIRPPYIKANTTTCTANRLCSTAPCAICRLTYPPTKISNSNSFTSRTCVALRKSS